jgi:hypothetical protein
VIVLKWGYITVSLVRKFSLAEERNPILYFPGKSWRAAGGGIAKIKNIGKKKFCP